MQPKPASLIAALLTLGAAPFGWSQQVAPAAEAPHPFAALAALRKPGSA